MAVSPIGIKQRNLNQTLSVNTPMSSTPFEGGTTYIIVLYSFEFIFFFLVYTIMVCYTYKYRKNSISVFHYNSFYYNGLFVNLWQYYLPQGG